MQKKKVLKFDFKLKPTINYFPNKHNNIKFTDSGVKTCTFINMLALVTLFVAIALPSSFTTFSSPCPRPQIKFLNT